MQRQGILETCHVTIRSARHVDATPIRQMNLNIVRICPLLDLNPLDRTDWNFLFPAWSNDGEQSPIQVDAVNLISQERNGESNCRQSERKQYPDRLLHVARRTKQGGGEEEPNDLH